MKNALIALLVIAALAGCAGMQGSARDALGNPRIERLTPQELTQMTPAEAPQLTLDEIVSMSQAGMPPARINDRIYQTATRIALTESDREGLRAAGVSEQVIAFIESYDREAQRTDALTRQADADAQARSQRRAMEKTYGNPYWGSPYFYGLPIFPYAGYGWSRWGSGWYGGVGIGF